MMIIIYFIYLFVSSAKALIENEEKKRNTHTKRKVYSHALIILERQRKTVSFSQTIYTKQIYNAINIFRTTKSAKVK